MAFEVFNIEIENKITNAVDTSLKKRKASLSQLRELNEDSSTRTDHPFLVATKAAAALHKSTFHSLSAHLFHALASSHHCHATVRYELP